MLGSRARVGVSMQDLPPAASLPRVQDEPGCVILPGGIIPVFLVLQQDPAGSTGFLSGREYWCPGALGFGETEGHVHLSLEEQGEMLGSARKRIRIKRNKENHGIEAQASDQTLLLN